MSLAGLRVLDFSRMIAGPYCAQELADLGAEVVKVESPEGDDSRRGQATVTPGLALFASVNRNKKSVVLDLKSAAGQQVALALVQQADVLVENFTPGVMDRLGLGYEAVAAANPRLVYCSISGYGAADRSQPSRPAYDGILQAITGMMDVTGAPGTPPARAPYFIVDTATGMTATSSILAALVGRGVHGRGQRVEVSLFDVAMAIMAPLTLQALATGKPPGRIGSSAPQSAPSDVFRTADGLVFITCGNNRLFQRLGEALQAPEFAARPEYATASLRVRHATALLAELQAILLQQDTAHWMRRFLAAGVPAGPVRDALDAVRSEEAQQAGSLVQVQAGDVHLSLIRSPHRLAGGESSPPPALGEHTRTVLREVLGWSESELAQRADAGAFGPR